MKESLQRVMVEYGRVAVVVYLTIFLAVLVGAWAAIHFGWRPESVAGQVGTLTAAYIATKVTQPARIALTLVLTPIAAKVYRRRPVEGDG